MLNKSLFKRVVSEGGKKCTSFSSFRKPVYWQLKQLISFICKNWLKTSRREVIADIIQIFYYMLSERWLMMFLPRKCLLACSGKWFNKRSIRQLSSGNVAVVIQIREVICFSMEVGYFLVVKDARKTYESTTCLEFVLSVSRLNI